MNTHDANNIRKRAEALQRVLQDAELPIGAIELVLQTAFDDGYRTRNPNAKIEDVELLVIEKCRVLARYSRSGWMSSGRRKTGSVR